jgi:hypothetical protein
LHERSDSFRRGVCAVTAVDDRVVHLAGGSVVTAVELAAEDEARAHPVPDRQEDEVVEAGGDPLPTLAERREIHVVLDIDRHVEPAPQLGADLDVASNDPGARFSVRVPL